MCPKMHVVHGRCQSWQSTSRKLPSTGCQLMRSACCCCAWQVSEVTARFTQAASTEVAHAVGLLARQAAAKQQAKDLEVSKRTMVGSGLEYQPLAGARKAGQTFFPSFWSLVQPYL